MTYDLAPQPQPQERTPKTGIMVFLFALLVAIAVPAYLYLVYHPNQQHKQALERTVSWYLGIGENPVPSESTPEDLCYEFMTIGYLHPEDEFEIVSALDRRAYAFENSRHHDPRGIRDEISRQCQSQRLRDSSVYYTLTVEWGRTMENIRSICAATPEHYSHIPREMEYYTTFDITQQDVERWFDVACKSRDVRGH